MSLIARQFVSYQERVIPKAATAVQVRETRRAFYAGAVAMLQEVVKAGAPGVSTREATKTLQALKQEMAQFRDEVMAGQA